MMLKSCVNLENIFKIIIRAKTVEEKWNESALDFLMAIHMPILLLMNRFLHL
jgi:hypothetical protein